MQTVQDTKPTPVPTPTEAKVENATPRPVPAPGRVVSFEEALEITLKEDKELLHRLAQ